MAESRTAIVTGSTSGIGLGIAEALAGSGMNVMLNGFGDAGEFQRAAHPTSIPIDRCYGLGRRLLIHVSFPLDC